MTFTEIMQDLKKGKYSPVYLLHGDEAYYIDKVADHIEQKVLQDGERDFNQTILYGRDVDLLQLISIAKRYPMASPYQVIIVKEAQDIKGLLGKDDSDAEEPEPLTKDKDKKKSKTPLLDYLAQPQPSTILVFCYKHKKADARTKIFKAIEKVGTVLLSAKLYEDKIPNWIEKYCSDQGFTIEPKASALLSAYAGANLSKLSNELDKLFINLRKGDTINAGLIEQYIGVSKDFNVFELSSALLSRDITKANKIINYFGANPKSGPMPMVLPVVFSNFIKLLKYQNLPDKNARQASAALGINEYFIKEYAEASKKYSVSKIVNIISMLRDYDLKSKGVNNIGTMPDSELMRELVFKIVH
ncbi:MAG: hypothetical protein RIQ89_2224 [Bacteroidota bacterium]|jgi:DNA polymerase III subunit delta